MSIISISSSYEGTGQLTPSTVLINTSDTLSQVMTAGYLNGQTITPTGIIGVTVSFNNGQMALVQITTGLIWLQVSIVGANTSLIVPQYFPRVQTASTRSLNTAFQVNSTKDSFVNYSVDIAATISLTTGQSGTVFLEIASDSGFTTNVQTLGQFTNGNAGTLAVGLNLTQTNTACLSGYVPAAYYCRLRTTNNTGTPTFTYKNGQEISL